MTSTPNHPNPNPLAGDLGYFGIIDIKSYRRRMRSFSGANADSAVGGARSRPPQYEWAWGRQVRITRERYVVLTKAKHPVPAPRGRESLAFAPRGYQS